MDRLPPTAPGAGPALAPAPASAPEIAPPGPGAARVRAARLVALGADLAQIVLLPLVIEGFASPLDDAIDLAVGLVLIKLVGFHWAFLPSAAVKLLPVADLAPTWTAAVLIATGTSGNWRRWAWIALAALVVLAAVAYLGVRAARGGAPS